MNLVNPSDIDEVQLALGPTHASLKHSGHNANANVVYCWECYVVYLYVVYLLERALYLDPTTRVIIEDGSTVI